MILYPASENMVDKINMSFLLVFQTCVSEISCYAGLPEFLN